MRGTETSLTRRAPLDFNSTEFAKSLNQLMESENDMSASGASGSSDAAAIGAAWTYRAPGALPMLNAVRHDAVRLDAGVTSQTA